MTKPVVIAPSRTVLVFFYLVIIVTAVETQLTARYLGPEVAATDVKVEQGSRELHENVQRELDYLRRDDICRDGDSYGPCDRERLRDILLRCPREICLFRMPRKGSSWSGDGDDPEFYIDYDEVYCTKPGTNCDRCWRGRWCNMPARCVHARYYRKFGRRERLARVCPGDFADPGDSSERVNGYETDFSNVTAASVSEDTEADSETGPVASNATVPEDAPCSEYATGCAEDTTLTSEDNMAESEDAMADSNGTNFAQDGGMNNSLPIAPWSPGNRLLLRRQ